MITISHHRQAKGSVRGEPYLQSFPDQCEKEESTIYPFHCKDDGYYSGWISVQGQYILVVCGRSAGTVGQ